MCDKVRLALAQGKRGGPLASLRGTPGGRCSGPSSMGPRQALLLLLLLLLHPPYPPPFLLPLSSARFPRQMAPLARRGGHPPHPP